MAAQKSCKSAICSSWVGLTERCGTSFFSLRYSLITAWNIACGFAQNKTQLIVFRLLAGLGGSAPLSVGSLTSSQYFQMKLKLVRLAEASSEMSGARKSVERLSLYTHSPLFWAPLSAQSAAAGMSLSDLAPGSNVNLTPTVAG